MSYFNFINLTDEVRQFMFNEMTLDIQNRTLYKSTRLNEAGRMLYSDLLKSAIQKGDAESFQKDLENGDFFNSTFLRQEKPVKMPSNAGQLLAQSEFNRYYIRGLCLKALKDNIELVEIYRARESSLSRPESENKIGMRVKAKELLNDLRNTIGKEPTILPEINSGLSVKLI